MPTSEVSLGNVFISFAQEDHAVAEAVKAVIERSFASLDPRLFVFLSSDRSTLTHGENWMDRIKRELAGCSVLVALLSKRSIQRPWVNFEAGAAWVPNKLLPVCYGNLRSTDLPRPFGDLIAVDLLNDPKGLITGISNLVRIPRKKGSLLPPATTIGLARLDGLDDASLKLLQDALRSFEDID